MVDSREKGARAENSAKHILIKHTGLLWQRVPGSGALSPEHMLKGDLYVPEVNNIYCIEVKHYKDDQISTKLITDKTPQFNLWWEQALRQAKQVNKEPLLIFKHDRSKFFVACFLDVNPIIKQLYIEELSVFICLLEDWLIVEKPKFIRNNYEV